MKTSRSTFPGDMIQSSKDAVSRLETYNHQRATHGLFTGTPTTLRTVSNLVLVLITTPLPAP